jgi:hypothetical protein
MKKLNYLLLLLPFFLLSCSNDSNSSSATPTSYSVQGAWKTTSAVLNGVEKFGGANPVKSEITYFDADGGLSTQSYSDTNFSTLYSYSIGSYTNPSATTLNQSANAYYPSGVLWSPYNISSEIILINSTQLHIKTLNFPATNDVYIKKYIR